MTPHPNSPRRAPIAVAVIDDHDVVHAGIALWCAMARPLIRVGGCYTTVQDFLTHHPRRGPGVDVVVVDLELTSRAPDLASLREVIEAGHRAVVYSHLREVEIVLRCLDAGASTYVTKDEGRTHLVSALRAAVADTAYVAPYMAGALTKNRERGRPNLTARETDALLAWFQTKNLDFVAAKLAVSPATVRTLLERARARYAAAGRPAPTKAAMLARAIQDGIISLNEV